MPVLIKFDVVYKSAMILVPMYLNLNFRCTQRVVLFFSGPVRLLRSSSGKPQIVVLTKLVLQVIITSLTNISIMCLFSLFLKFALHLAYFQNFH